MKLITFYLDFLCPASRRAFEQLPEVLADTSYCVRYVPIKAPAGTRAAPGGAAACAVRLASPLPLPPGSADRKAIEPATLALMYSRPDDQGSCNRYVCETIFRYVQEVLSKGGGAAGDAALPQALSASLPALQRSADAAEAQLLRNCTVAGQVGAHIVPAFQSGNQLVFGRTGLAALRQL